jgi:hypothetical protein
LHSEGGIISIGSTEKRRNKMKRSLKVLLFSAVIILAFKGCDKSVEPDNGGRLSYQVNGCLSKSADTCFYYTFNNDLVTNFCVEANCCPDSNRFTFRHTIIADTINLYVNDIEEKLCRCICTYSLHTSFMELPLDSYLLNIIISYRDEEPLLLYSQRVHRSE